MTMPGRGCQRAASAGRANASFIPDAHAGRMLHADAIASPNGMPAARAPATALSRAAEGALIESRQRWRDLVGLATDLVFETDAEGRLRFLAPDPALGWPAAALLGRRPAEEGLLLRPDADPFSLRGPVRDLRAWLRRRDAAEACLSFSVAPLLGPDGSFAGLRGAARDITREISETEAQAQALRRALAVETLVRKVREAVLAPRMLPALLDLLPAAIGCSGAAMVPLGSAGEPEIPPPLDATGRPTPPPQLRLRQPGHPVFCRGNAGEPLALVPQAGAAVTAGDAAPQQALLVWRDAGERPFDADERHLLQALSDLLGVVLGNQRLLLELERQAQTDGMTGLLNRRAFLEALRRRQDRLRHAGCGGALVFLDVDNLKPVNDRFGHEAGDMLLTAVAGLLRRSTRDVDLAARLGGDEFALWLDGVAAEEVARGRADALCMAAAALALTVPGGEARLPVSVSLGIAIATAAGAEETPEALLARADAALYAAKRAGRNTWHLAPAA